MPQFLHFQNRRVFLATERAHVSSIHSHPIPPFLAVTSRFDGGDITSCDITIPTILSDYIFSDNDCHKARHFLITVGIFYIDGQAGAN